MKIPTTLFLLAAALVLASGCATINTVEPAESSATPHRVADKRIITDNRLNDIAYVVGVTDSTVSGNIKRVQVKLRNMTSAVRTVNYVFQWYDGQGMAITSPAPAWQSVSLEGGQTVPVTDTAPSPQAGDWQLSLSESVGRPPGPIGGTPVRSGKY